MTCSKFINDIYKICNGLKRVHIEIQEFPITYSSHLNFRKKVIHTEKPWKIISTDSDKDNILSELLRQVLSNAETTKKKIRRIGLVCSENSIILANQLTKSDDYVEHYIFGQTIAICNSRNQARGQLTYVDIRDLEFNQYSVKNTKVVFDKQIKIKLENLKPSYNSDDLPF